QLLNHRYPAAPTFGLPCPTGSSSDLAFMELLAAFLLIYALIIYPMLGYWLTRRSVQSNMPKVKIAVPLYLLVILLAWSFLGLLGRGFSRNDRGLWFAGRRGRSGHC